MAYYAEPAAVTLLRQAARLAQKVVVVERTARSSLLGPAATAADVPFTVRVTLLRGAGNPVPGTLGELVDAYAALAEGRLVITGAAGAGKTVLALELVLLLLQRRRPEQPVPVRLSLAEWDTDTPLERWLVRQVSETYSVRLRAAEVLVAQRMVLPVLDGLDEMDGEAGSSMRAARALEQINRYHGPRGATPLVLTCRATTYERVSRDHGGLASSAVAKVEELDTGQIRSYLEQALAARSEGEKRAWAEVIDHLDQLPAGALGTPWRLYLATTVYSGGRDPRDLLALEALGEVDRVLLERLIPVAIETSPHRGYDAKRVKKWLTSFAVNSTNPGNESVDGSGPVSDISLYRLESIFGRKRVQALHWIVFTLVGGGLLFWFRSRTIHLPGENPMWLAFGAIFFGVMLGGFAMGISVEPIRPIHPRRRKREEGESLWDILRRNPDVVELHLKGRAGRHIWTWVGSALLGFAVIVMLIMKFLIPTSWLLAPLYALGTTIAISLGLFLWACAQVAYEAIPVIFAEADAEPVLKPSAPLRQDAVVSALAVGSMGMLAPFWAKVALVLALAILPYVVGRAWVRYVIAIAVGSCRGMAPLRLAHFLSWAHRAGLMRTTGRTYQFRHRDLQQWLVDEYREREEAAFLFRRARDGSVSDRDRLEAADTLVGVGDPEGPQALYHLANDTNVQFGIRVQAIQSLAEVDDLRDVAVGMLSTLSKLASVSYGPMEFVTVVKALDELAPASAFSMVQQVAQNAEARRDVQELAASTLRRVAEPLPPSHQTPGGGGRANEGSPAASTSAQKWDKAVVADLVRKNWGKPGA
ncbi:NACHT domain-containing protein [Streptomyces sp. NPDC048295]|uniref:NACHT domain-containing protein n=1 Tax=Streptomyces sp. NPDC048295 TaxID=3154617 RepID=UPI003424D40D